MRKIPSQIRNEIESDNAELRESAARQLRCYPGKSALRYLKQLLTDDHAEVQYTAAASIIAIGGKAAAEIIAPLLRSQNVALRNTAIEIMAKIGKAAIDRAAELLIDRDKDIRKFGVDILEKIGSSEAKTHLVKALLDDNVNVSAAAAEALGKCGTQSAVPHLIACLDRTAWLKCAALRSLGAIGGEDAFNAIAGIDSHEESMVLFSAVSALGALGDSRGIEYLLRLLDKEDRALDPAIMQAVENIFNKSYLQKLAHVSRKIDPEKILPMLDSDNSETVRSAIGLLGLLRAENAVGDLVKLFTESNRFLLEDLEQALIQIKPYRIQPLIAIVENDREPDSVKLSALRIIGATGRREALQPLVSCLKTAGESLKTEIIRVMATLGDSEAIGPLERLLTDPSDQVKLAAIEALQTFRSPSSVAVLLSLTNDSSEQVRSAAAQSLRNYDLSNRKVEIKRLLGSQDAVSICFGLGLLTPATGPVFENDVFRLCRFEDSRVRRLAVKSVGLMENKNAVDTIIKAFSDTDETVRLAAIRAIKGPNAQQCADGLVKIANADSSDWNRYEAVQTIGRLKLTHLLPELLEMLKTCPDLVKAAIIDTLAEWGHQQSKKIMERYAISENDALRHAALKALEKTDL